YRFYPDRCGNVLKIWINSIRARENGGLQQLKNLANGQFSRRSKIKELKNLAHGPGLRDDPINSASFCLVASSVLARAANCTCTAGLTFQLWFCGPSSESIGSIHSAATSGATFWLISNSDRPRNPATLRVRLEAGNRLILLVRIQEATFF